MNNKKYSNLKPWQPGQSGNPAGRKPGSKNISTMVAELLDEEATADMLAMSGIAELTQGASTSYAKAVVWATIQKAVKGNMQAIMWLAEQQERASFSAVQQERQQPLVVSFINSRNQSTVD
jgi:hypothetical protein